MDLMRELLASPLAQNLMRKDAERLNAERQQLGAELAKLDRENAKLVPVLRDAVYQAQQQVRDARDALAKAEAVFGQAWSQQVSESLRFGDARAEIEARLRASADPRIAAFVKAQQAQIDTVRGSDDAQEVTTAKLVALRWSVQQAEALALSADADVEQALKRIGDHVALEVAA